jgi:crotonobetainyl-CoA:carnitine CoA-transferase CaiB-like acyl-CoA transferase
MTSVIGDTLMDFALSGRAPACDGNRHPDMAPHGVYPCRAGEWIAIAISSDDGWRQLASAIGSASLADNALFRTHADRKANEEALDNLVALWTSRHDARELAGELQKTGIAAAKSASSLDLVSDQHLWSRGFFRSVTGSAGQKRPIVGPSWKMSREARIVAGAPRLGEHNPYVLEDMLAQRHKL